MRYFLMLILAMIFSSAANASDSTKVIKRVYMIPGQGSDERIYKNISIKNKEVIMVHWIMPERNESMNSLARRMAAQIDTTEPFAIIGVSFGGMVACEMSTFLNPQKIIIISSASTRKELPPRYRFMKHVPVYKIFPPSLIKAGAKIMQPLVEPDRNKEKQTCKSMLHDKDKLFLKRSIHCIVTWEPKVSTQTKIIHIHGTNDHTLPCRFVKADYLIKNGSHMMTLTRSAEISELLNHLLNE